MLFEIEKWYHALDSLVIGPGMGRDFLTSMYISDIIKRTKKENLLILDADFFWYLSKADLE